MLRFQFVFEGLMMVTEILHFKRNKSHFSEIRKDFKERCNSVMAYSKKNRVLSAFRWQMCGRWRCAAGAKTTIT